MPTANPVWFDADFFATQKVDQMNAIQYAPEWLDQHGNGATAWTVDLYNQFLAEYTFEGKAVTAYENFEAMNGAGYDPAEIQLDDINASPNQYFSIPVYLQALADYNNANPDAYGPTADGSPWTMQLELDEIFSKYQSSVWEHYNQNWDKLLDVNPSNDFDTNAYLRLRAEAMGDGATVEDAIAAIKADGLNPIQDFYINGPSLNITEAPAVEAGSEINPADASWNPWGESDTPVEPGADDPYEANHTETEILPGETGPYEGEAGHNTWFTAAWSGTGAAASTLSAADVIKGGENAMNSLVVDLDNNWSGFKGQGDNPFALEPNVTNVGRIVLNHNANHAEVDWTFNAQNISADTVRYDLNGVEGAGTINLTQLNGAVERINIKDIKGPDIGHGTSTTSLEWQSGAHKGKADSLTIGVDNVCAEGAANTITGLDGIETITVDAMGGSNNIDITSANGAKTVLVEGAGALTLDSDANGVKTYDASSATGGVNFKLQNAAKQTITGGSGFDTVSLKSTGNTVNASGWSSIEALTLDSNVAIVNAKGLVGLEQVWINNGAQHEIRNLDAANLTVRQTVDSNNTTTINGGDLGNIAWISATNKDERTGVLANVASNATGDVSIELVNEDFLSNNSSFTFAKATGTVSIKAPNNADALVNGYVLAAGKATGLDVTATGDFIIDTAANGSDLASVQNVNINMTANDNGGGDLAIGAGLDAARQITVKADGENVTFASIGTTRDGVGFEMQIENAGMVTTGNMEAQLGGNITANIAAEGNVSLGHITTETNTAANDQGDVRLKVTTENDNSNLVVGDNNTIHGGGLFLDFSGVTGTVNGGIAPSVILEAEESINYKGAQGSDNVAIGEILAGSSQNQITLGDGADSLTINNGLALSTNKVTTIGVDLGADTEQDTLTVANRTGLLLVNVSNFDGGIGGDTIDLSTIAPSLNGPASIDDANAVLKQFGMSLPNGFTTSDTDGVFLKGDASQAIVVLGSANDDAVVMQVSGDNIGVANFTM